ERRAARPRRHGDRSAVHEPGAHDRPGSAAAQGRRRDPLSRLVGAAMSRVGKEPIPVPSGVDVSIDGAHVVVKGPKGTLEHDAPPSITVARDGDSVIVTRSDDERENRALHGLTRSLVANMVHGVNEGYARELEIVGVGYRAIAQGPTKLELQVGF